MRIETRSDGSGVNHVLQAIRARNGTPVVSLDGKKLMYVLIADTDAGYVRYVPEDDRGMPLCDIDLGNWVIQEAYGVVRISIRYR